MRTLIVTGADEAYMPLLRGLLLSLQQWQPQPFTALACFDLGLAADSRDWVGRYARHIIEPGWDVPVHEELRRAQPHLRALTVRPFLRDYFPGYDLYLWLDADTWVQEPFALGWLFDAARSGALAAAPEADRAYRDQASTAQWRHDWMLRGFGAEAGNRALWDRYVNAGVFALRADAPHWRAWGDHLRGALQGSDGRAYSEQSALNYMLWRDGLPLIPMPPLCNWLCHLALPSFREADGRFCEPHVPWQPIGIIHMTHTTKDLQVEPGTGAAPRPPNLRFPGAR